MKGATNGHVAPPWIPRHLPHDNHLRFQERARGVGMGELVAVVGEDDHGAGVVVGFHFVAEGGGREGEAVSQGVCLLVLVYDHEG